MRVTYRAVPSVKPHLPTVYRQGPVRWCCASMARWWGLVVGFGVKGCAAVTSRTVNLYLAQPQVGGKTAVEVVPVDFCPWCGEVVETCRTK
jgi:hypothetical protein